MNDIIGQLLKAGLLRTLGDDQERVDRLRAASRELRDRYLSNARSEVPSALLAAIDEDTSGELPVLSSARHEIVAKWEMFENTFAQQDPVTILRAVVLDAVVAASLADNKISAAAWYTLRNAVGKISVDRWSSQVKSITVNMEEATEDDIAQLWIPEVNTSTIRMPSVSDREVPEATFVVPGLAKLRQTIKPHMDNNPQHVANLVGRETPTLLNSLGKAVIDYTAAEGEAETKRLKKVLGQLGEKLRSALLLQEQALEALARRDHLLWWRLSGRSDLLQTRYADAPDPASAAVAAAVDLCDRVPSLAPPAVEDLLVSGLTEANLADRDVTIDTMVAAANRMQLTTRTDAIRPFLLADVVVGGCDPGGLPRTYADTTSAADAAVLLFQGLQARRLLIGDDAQGEDS